MTKKSPLFINLSLIPLFFLILIPFNGEAATNFLKITNITPSDNAFVNAALSEFETNVNQNLPSIESADLTKDSVNSNIIANKGMGVDYTNSMKRFLVGWSQSGSVNFGSSDNILSGAKTVKGFGMATQFSFGLNLQPLKKRNLMDLPSFWGLDLNNSKVFMGLMAGKTSQEVSGYTLGFEILTLNLRIMTKLKKAEDFKSYFFKWGGIDLNTGIETNKTTLSVGVPRNDSITASNNWTTELDGTVGFKVESLSLSIPLEVSASVTFFSFLDFFWGLGTDLNFGYGKGSSFSDSKVYIYAPGANTPTATADAELNVGATSPPSILNARWFTGAQLNLWKMKVALQAQHSIIHGIWGFGANFNFIF